MHHARKITSQARVLGFNTICRPGLIAPLLLSCLLTLLSALPAFAGNARLNTGIAGLKGLKPPFTFVVVGDNRSGTDTYGRIVNMITKDNPSFVVNTGDVTWSRGNGRKWAEFVELSKPLKMPYFIAPGNHEIGNSDDEQFFRENAAEPGNGLYYSFVAGNALFVVLDSEQPGLKSRIDGAQLEWLEGVLKESKEKFKFVFVHRPLYPDRNIGRHYSDSLNKYPASRDRLQALFREYNVDVVFAGHEHLYQKQIKDGVVHVITGGGGAPLYAPDEKGGFHHYIKVTIDRDKAEFDVIDLGRRTRDSLGITKGKTK